MIVCELLNFKCGILILYCCLIYSWLEILNEFIMELDWVAWKPVFDRLGSSPLLAFVFLFVYTIFFIYFFSTWVNLESSMKESMVSWLIFIKLDFLFDYKFIKDSCKFEGPFRNDFSDWSCESSTSVFASSLLIFPLRS